jgi:hypothetical protein
VIANERRSRLGAWALALVLVLVGAAAGAALDRLAAAPDRPRGPPTPDELVARLTRDLRLTDAQARDVRGIVEQRWTALGRLFERIDPEAEAIRRDADARIRALLDDRQRTTFDAHVAEIERRRAEMRRRLGSAAPAPP